MNISLTLNALFFTTCIVVGSVQAANTVSVKVTVLAPLPCVINGNKPIEVDFGDEVMTTRVNGSNYRTAVNYSVTCVNPEKSGMRFQIVGETTTFDSDLLKTNFGGLGIGFLQDEKRIKLNRWQNFTYPALPKLEAVPVKLGGSVLPAGEFRAAATFRVDYQ